MGGPRSGEERLTVAVLEALVHALEAKSGSLAGHSSRVSAYAATIASELGLTDAEVDLVRTAGRLHDLGMIGIRESVLDKAGRLTRDEYEHVKRHVEIGVHILAPLTQLSPVIQAVKGHHERWDGAGYPDGLAGDAIPVGARVIHVAEVYDALTTERPYQNTFSEAEAIERLEEIAGSVLDPVAVDAFAASVRGRRTLSFVSLDPPPMEEDS